MAYTQNYNPYIPFFPHPPPHNPPKVTPPYSYPPSPPKVAPPHHSPSPPKVPSPSHPFPQPPLHNPPFPPKVTPPHSSPSPPPWQPPFHPSPSPPKVPSPPHPAVSPPPPRQPPSPVPATPPTPAAKPPTHSKTPPAPIAMPPPHPFLSPSPLPPPHDIPSSPSPSSGHQSTVMVAVLVSLGGLFCLAFLSAALCCFLRKKGKVEKSEIAEIDEHVKVHETIMAGPHGEEVKVVSIKEDVHIQQDVDKKSVIEGKHKQPAHSSPHDLNSEESTSGTNHQNVGHEG